MTVKLAIFSFHITDMHITSVALAGAHNRANNLVSLKLRSSRRRTCTLLQPSTTNRELVFVGLPKNSRRSCLHNHRLLLRKRHRWSPSRSVRTIHEGDSNSSQFFPDLVRFFVLLRLSCCSPLFDLLQHMLLGDGGSSQCFLPQLLQSLWNRKLLVARVTRWKTVVKIAA